MRLFWLPLMLLALPAAADTTVLIPLHHTQVSVFEQLFVPAEARTALPGILVNGDGGLLPDGISAWTIDERRNALRVSGSEDGIADLKRIVAVVDDNDAVARQVRISTKVVRLEAGKAASLHGVTLPPPATGSQPASLAFLESPAKVAALESRNALASSDLTVTSGHPLHLLWPVHRSQSPARVEIVPRVNSDGTATLYIRREGGSAAGFPGGVAVVRRIAPDHGVAIFSPTLGTALIVRVQEVTPVAEKAGP